ncbi:SDR family oxidoreductase [Rubripirellula amarantea]|nr:SDR family oxidoreductase [Rubripirellula amarantea]
MSQQLVIVFGAAKGIGLEIARQFVSEGSRVVGVDRQLPDADMGQSGIEFVLGDVTSLDEMKHLAQQHPEIGHVVFSVGKSSGKSGFPYWNVEPSDWASVIEVNLLGAVNVAHTFGPLLADSGQGSIMFLTSVAGQVGSQTDPPYSASKAALINFMQCVAKDLAPFGVRANAIAPGMVQTDLNRQVWQAGQILLQADAKESYDDWAARKIARIAPLNRWQTPQEIAAMAVFLASDHARNITGQTINVDGGQVMHS